MMTTGRRWILVVGFAFVALLVTQRQGFADGKKLFISNSCNKCHTIKSVGVAKKADSEAEKLVDLSKVGGERSAAWLSKYLLKEESINGKKHKKKFGGSAADLDELSKWLSTLK